MPFTKEFLETNLDYKIESFSESAGSKLGDNYATVLKSIAIKLENHPFKGSEVNLVTKILPLAKIRVEFIQRSNIFWKELQFYEWWMPKIEKFQRSLGVENIILPTLPPFLFGFADNYDGMVFEEKQKNEDGSMEIDNRERDTPDSENCLFMVDVRNSMGYKLAERSKGLNLEEMNAVVKEMAKLHALSWVYKCKNGIDKLTDLNRPLFIDTFLVVKADDMFQQWQEMSRKLSFDKIETRISSMENGRAKLDAAIEFSKNIPEIDPLFTSKEGTDERKLESYMKIKDDKNLDDSDALPWLVVCHGDAAMHNFLFKYDENGQFLNAMLLDLQLMREACPTTDLAYLIYISTEPSMRKIHLNEILQTYHEEFINVCRQLNSPLLPGFSFENLQRRFRRAKMFGFINALMALPLLLKPAEEVLDMDKIKVKDTTEFAKSFFNENENPNEVLQKWLIGMIEELYDEGVF